MAHHVPRDGDPDLPIKLRLASNGGFYPPMPGELALETARRTRAVADVQARRLGVSRRHFMLSAARSATMLATDLGPVPTDPEDAAVSTSTDECVFGVQGHFLADPEGTELPLPGFPQDECGQADPHGCYSAETFLALMFNQSDTSMLMLSAIPPEGDLLTERMMADAVTDFPIAAWKSYTPAGGPGWFLDDHDPDAPQVGHALLDHTAEIGPPIVAVQKDLTSVGGNPANAPYSNPVDVGPPETA